MLYSQQRSNVALMFNTEVRQKLCCFEVNVLPYFVQYTTTTSSTELILFS